MEYIKEIYGQFDSENIIIYQAYKKEIALEAVQLNTFGKQYDFNRMSWIKPSFLWMMYRSNWARKKNQEHILEIKIKRKFFNNILEKAVLTSNESGIFKSYGEWKNAFISSEVYCQWDSDRNFKGNTINRAAIQLGLKGRELEHLVNQGIANINDITENIIKMREQIINGKKINFLPKEKLYVVNRDIRMRLNMRL